MSGPLHQFEIQQVASIPFMGFDIAVTNQAITMLVSLTIMSALLILGSRQRAMVPGRLQSFVEMTYEFVEDMIKGTAGRAGLKFMPLIMSVFLFVAVCNVVGMVPGAYTSTSQLFVTALMAFGIFAFVIAIGFWKHGLEFLGMFVPAGTPWWLYWLIIPLELISFFARPFTLTVRLVANMVAGHILLKIFAGFAVMMTASAVDAPFVMYGGFFAVVGLIAAFIWTGKKSMLWAALAVLGALGVIAVFSGGMGIIATFMPSMFIFVITILEVFVALLQAYIFTILTCVYLNDALHMH
ncbi:MAG: F0F1 ATP synthase subunit A [Proteobacteria bacterium]|nr:F0F1 ATP synthase subunit A [Pseudomonadota bacterium]